MLLLPPSPVSRRARALSAICLPSLLLTLGCAGDEGPSEPGGTGGVSTGGTLGTGGNASGGNTGGVTGTGGIGSGGGDVLGTGGSDTDSGGTDPGTGGADGPGGDTTCQIGIADGTPEPLTLSGNLGTHDPTMIKVNGTFYRFQTGPNIPSSKSTNLTSWEGSPSVYKSRPAWADDWLGGVSGQTFNFPWAPDVSEFNGQVHLYSSFSAKFGQNISCITHLTANNIETGDWTDHGPVICSDGSENYNAIDADVGFDDDGTPYFSFGSFWGGIHAFELNVDGSRKEGSEVVRLAWANQIEAPVMVRRCGYHYLFVTYGLCCPGEGRSVDQLTYRVAVGRSESILGPYVDKAGKPMIDGGGTVIVQGDDTNFAAAGHSDVIFDGDKAYHLYHGYRAGSGAAELRIAELFFDEEGWPMPHAP